MPNALLNTSGLNDGFVKVVERSYNLLNKNGEAVIIADDNDIQSLLAELAAANVNIFSKYTTLLNVLQVAGCYFIQVKTLSYVAHDYARNRGTIDITNYFLSQLGYKKLNNDYGIIRIEPVDIQPGYVVKLLSHIFSSDDLVIHGHERFNNSYHIHATDKQQAATLMSDSLLDAISAYENLHISIVRDSLIIWATELNENSTIAIRKIMETVPA